MVSKVDEVDMAVPLQHVGEGVESEDEQQPQQDKRRYLWVVCEALMILLLFAGGLSTRCGCSTKVHDGESSFLRGSRARHVKGEPLPYHAPKPLQDLVPLMTSQDDDDHDEEEASADEASSRYSSERIKNILSREARHRSDDADSSSENAESSSDDSSEEEDRDESSFVMSASSDENIISSPIDERRTIFLAPRDPEQHSLKKRHPKVISMRNKSSPQLDGPAIATPVQARRSLVQPA